tara:strand:+ start:132 stop:569 length:438 start_codon:yes stop_codon:yes gene_type:complete
MPNVFIREKGDYNLEIIRGDKVVVDNATGLMWHQSGSDDIEWNKAKKWIKKLNKRIKKPNKIRGYAGYHDWRLPTVDEAVSLLESNKMNGNLYIDPVFSEEQLWIWTGDKFENEVGSEVAWNVNFRSGDVDRSIISCVRPVRSME